MDARDTERLLDMRMSVDERAMTVTLNPGDEEELVLPLTWEVCELCEGKGKHVNPSIDAHGLTHEDFAEDPDFAEGYRSGMYDVTCYRCGGKRVQPSSEDPRFHEHVRSLHEAAAERAHEIAMRY